MQQQHLLYRWKSLRHLLSQTRWDYTREKLVARDTRASCWAIIYADSDCSVNRAVVVPPGRRMVHWRHVGDATDLVLLCDRPELRLSGGRFLVRMAMDRV